MNRILNVSTGPTSLPYNVFKNIQINMNSRFINGKSPLEMSHRSNEFLYLLKNIKYKLRNFMDIPSNYSILFTPGGASAQFSSIMYNLRNHNNALYITNGLWSQKAYNETQKFTINADKMNIFDYHYDKKNNKLKNYDYIYFCNNETVDGIELNKNTIPYPVRTHDNCLIISDMCSSFGQRIINWKDFDIVFASTSKNMGIAGTNILIINNELLNKLPNNNTIPSILDWKLNYNTDSLYNTPCVFNFYVLNEMLEYYINQGTIYDFDKLTNEKGNIIYDVLDNHNILTPIVDNKKLRSNISIPFKFNNFFHFNYSVQNYKFLKYCEENDIIGLKTDIPFDNEVPPLRINLYNHLSLEDTKHMAKINKTYK